MTGSVPTVRSELATLVDAEAEPRQLHALEQRVAPELEAQISTTTRALDEREREDQTRLRALRRKSRKR
ncbi:MAG: V-type ATP synthase subunit D [Kofleriaceae bacterium]